MATTPTFEVAVIGGGIIGVMTALGLLRHGMRVSVYERADNYPEIGVGMAFTGVARDCMRRLDPRVLEALSRVGEENQHAMNRYWDGFNPTSKESAQSPDDALLFQLSARELAYWGCLRSRFLQEMAAELPDGVVKFGKQLASAVDDTGSEKVILRFADGSEAEADVVIGCDGIHSQTRKLVLGQTPAASPGFAHQVAYRAVVPIAEAVAALGEDKANNQCAHMGPNGFILSYPVNKWTLSNVAIFLHDPHPWPNPDKLTAPGTRDEVTSALSAWSPAIQDLASRLPPQLAKWAIFDTADHPAPTYANGRICLAGDAAHASSPFHGAGACMGVEDATVLAVTLGAAQAKVVAEGGFVKKGAIRAALKSFSDVCIERSQWLVRSSRETGEICQWRYPATGRDAEKCRAEFEARSRKIWDFDVGGLVGRAEREFERHYSLGLAEGSS